MKFYSNSQSGQDRFAYSLIGKKGTFLDIGCGHPVAYNNSYSLEVIGWTGILIDQDDHCYSLRGERKNPWIKGDAVKIDWNSILKPFKGRINYLSLDVDIGTFEVLKTLPLRDVAFDVITIEHDAYRFGETLRLPERGMLQSAGYELIAADVKDKGLEFEDWWVRAGVFDDHKLTPYRSIKKDWKEVLSES
jgi:hypothetical protein